ncbi:PREDICTED: heat shock 70 kDa protein 12A-like [Amphimedon queenslandica]|nr:PREDICTED: heat shock 70 kDa protein 12A-like [Amphimedon queenslandica]|eukprot:XP_019849463.1 PREDICTED: heat shock 70 kDa protein 12A-like [Amphimedon queenslandica]
MMREAAYMAGLLTESKRISEFTPISSSPLPVPDEVNPDKLSLALEPEAAALYSQETVAEQIKGQPSAAAISHPTEYMVIDAGGGTIDITAHVEVDGGIVVQNVPTGNAWGGTQVNEGFSKLLQELVNDPGFEKFIASGDHTKNQATLNKIVYTEFEKQKVLFGQGKLEEIAVELPRNFVRFYEEALIEGAEKMSGTDYDPDENDTLRINKSVTESKLFGPAIQGIIDCTLAAISKIDNCPNTFYLVGAFGGCKYVHEKVSPAIKRYYQSKGHKGTCSVLVPPSPHLAVATGAAMWRKNPEKFKARRADATYGIGLSFPFDPEKHNEAYKCYIEDYKGYYCNYIFNIFLEEGELAKANEVITTYFTPRCQDNTTASIKIYSTPQLGVRYIRDENNKLIVTEIGQLVIDVPNPDNLPLDQRIVDVTIDFSGTEIQAKARYRVTGKEVKTVCDFLST